MEKRLANYILEEIIGRGGFGIVYKAMDENLKRYVALKVLHPQLTVDPKFVNNFKKEAQTLAKIDHENVVKINTVSQIEDQIFISMQYLPGGNLADRLKNGAISLSEALKIVTQVAAGLNAGHKIGIIHRDVKPGNVLFDENGNAVIADFGVARAVRVSSIGTLSEAGSGVGTPYYRPPELWQAGSPPSPATDVYSLACVFYEMITGVVLFGAETTEQVLTKHIIEDPANIIGQNNGDLPEHLKAILIKAVAKKPGDRYKTITAFVDALAVEPEPEKKKAVAGRKKREPKTSTQKNLLKRFPTWGLIIIGLISALCLIGGGIFASVYFWGASDTPTPKPQLTMEEFLNEDSTDEVVENTPTLIVQDQEQENEGAPTISMTVTKTEKPSITPSFTDKPPTATLTLVPPTATVYIPPPNTQAPQPTAVPPTNTQPPPPTAVPPTATSGIVTREPTPTPP